MMWVPMNAVRMEDKAAFTGVGPCLCAMNLFESDPIRGRACLLLLKFFITLAVIHWVLTRLGQGTEDEVLPGHCYLYDGITY